MTTSSFPCSVVFCCLSHTLEQTCSNVGSVYGCNSDDDIASFGSIDAIFKTEAETTTRYMLMGRRYAKACDSDFCAQASLIEDDHF